MNKRFRPGGLHRWRDLPADPVAVDRFVQALKVIAESFRQSAGRLAPALGQTRLLVPLTLFLRQEYTQAEIVSILLRLQALQVLFQEGALDDWAGPDPEDGALFNIHPAAIEAAATLPLDEGDRFDAELFAGQVAQIAGVMETGCTVATVKVPAP
jgi:hypothetical protein